jgi:CheY-like chemotaxis protein
MRDQIILLVEDNADDEALVLRAFQKNDIRNEVVIARDGVEALDYLFATGAYAERDARRLPALTLLDLKLPKLDGLDVLRRVRAAPRTRLLPVIILSSSNQERDIVESYRAGANSYVRKAVDFAHFSETVGTLAHYWLHLNIAPPRPD